jgi:hypothetical protein
MKKKIGILIEERVMRLVQCRAAEEGKTLSNVIQDALVSYLSDKVPDPKKRENAYQLFCGQPMRIGKKHFNEILEERAWEE